MSSINGREIKAFLFCCYVCGLRIFQYREVGSAITASEAASNVRDAGWSKKACGWHCPACGGKKQQ